MSQGNGLEKVIVPWGCSSCALGEPAVPDHPPQPFTFTHSGKAHPSSLHAMCRTWLCTRSGMSQSPGHSGC